MSEKYLPVKIFEKRKEYDDRRTEPGGDSREPSYVLHGDAFRQHAAILGNSVSTIRTSFREWNEKSHTLPLVMSTTMKEAALAKSHRGQMVGLLDSDGKENVIGISGDREILSLVTDEKLLDKISSVLQSERNAAVVSAIDDMEVYKPLVEELDGDSQEYRIRLFNYNDYDRNQMVKILFEQYCRKNEIKINSKVRFTSDIYLYRVTVDSLEQLGLIEDFEGLYTAEKTNPMMVTLDSLDFDMSPAVKYPREGESYPLVGILDSGVSDIDHLEPWIEDKQHSNYPEEYQDNGHGTFVAGIVEYGDELNDRKTTAMDGVRLFNAVVYPNPHKETIYPEDLVDNIRDAVERNPEVKIWNLSLGTNEDCDVDYFSEFGMALDNIQDENDVLIIKSAGNCTNFRKGLPKGKIAKSADSVRALTIGSIAQYKEEYDYAEVNMPSPFTRVGPGPSSIIKPDLVYYGGNVGFNDDGNEIRHGVKSFGLDDSILRNVGTSFSTPAVSRIAAELSFMMNEEFDPLLIRALMIHYAKYPEGIPMKMNEKVSQLGFGMPVGAQDILYNSPDEITLILRDNLEKGNFIEMFDFPYPTKLVDENGFFTGQIILTLVNKSIVDDKQSAEYCQSNMDVYFGTYETEVDRDTSKRTVINPKGLDDNHNVLVESNYSSRVKGIHPVTGFERECTLVKYGKKYHPVKKYAVDLAEMTPANKERNLQSDRKWYLKIVGLYRDFIEKEAVKNDNQLSQDFCMILTIRDPNKTTPVYDEVTQLLTSRNFIHHDVRVRNNIQVTNTI